MKLADFDFELPDELIAQVPADVRSRSRLMVLHRDDGRIEHSVFENLGSHLRIGDLLVLNNTKVFPARLLGRRVPSGGAVECLLLRQIPTSDFQLPKSFECPPDLGIGKLGIGSSEVWEALVHPGQKLKPGARILFERDGMQIRGEIRARHFHGRRTVQLWTDGPFTVTQAIERIGHIPLPPYIKRPDRDADRERYQTVYARERGSIAAPTAGLHFTTELLDALAGQGIEWTEVTLHVGYGTFKPIQSNQIEHHVVDPEACAVTAAAAEMLTRAWRERRRIIAVGTTTMRVLESLVSDADGRIRDTRGEVSLFIRPGHQFRIASGLITNFHLPRSSLLVLVAAFAGRERILNAYREAIARRYRFYSYGDAMLIV